MTPDIKPFLTPPRLVLANKRLPLFCLIVMVIAMFLPWSRFTSGSGRLTAVDPNERILEINAPVGGFIEHWHISEGTHVKRGDTLVELVDADPSLMKRIQRESEAAKSGLAQSQLADQTARLNLERQRKLLEEGLTSRKEFEKAKIEASKYTMEVAKATSTLTKAETQVSRQHSQSVVAPRDGTVVRMLPGEGNQLVKAGDALMVFAPDVTSLAVEMWINGNDLRFVERGNQAQVQFEGWPSVQIPGWPSVAIGTFKARVHLVDHASSHQGKFRVLLVPDRDPWPSSAFLRLNASARGMVTLGQTVIGLELWRQLNGFPPQQEPIRDELARLLAAKKAAKDDDGGAKDKGK